MYIYKNIQYTLIIFLFLFHCVSYCRWLQILFVHIVYRHRKVRDIHMVTMIYLLIVLDSFLYFYTYVWMYLSLNDVRWGEYKAIQEKHKNFRIIEPYVFIYCCI